MFSVWAMAGCVVLIVAGAVAAKWYSAGDASVLARLQSARYSLFEVVQSEVAAFCARTRVPDLRQEQRQRIAEYTARSQDRYARHFLDSTAAGAALSPTAGAQQPLFIPLLSRTQRMYALSDIDLVKWVLSDATGFDRARTLESFADAFQLNSVFTTKDKRLHSALKTFFTKHTNKLSPEQHVAMLSSFESCVGAMMDCLWCPRGAKFIPKVEGMVLQATAEAFFGLRDFPDAEEFTVLIKDVWTLKSLRNNVPWKRWNPQVLLRLRQLRRRMFEICKQAERLAAQQHSAVAYEMAQVYRTHGYGQGNLLNALIPLYEAIARGVVYALVELANAPQTQAALYEEIQQNRVDALRYSRSTKTLLHRVWLETLRLRPPTPNQTRRVTSVDNPLFPRGAKVVVVWSVFHSDPEVWGDDASEFKPSRWLEASAVQHKNYNPFGTGAQKCVAQNYGSLAGRMALMHIVAAAKIEHVAATATTDSSGDRGYSRGPEPEATVLRFVSRDSTSSDLVAHGARERFDPATTGETT